MDARLSEERDSPGSVTENLVSETVGSKGCGREQSEPLPVLLVLVFLLVVWARRTFCY